MWPLTHCGRVTPYGDGNALYFSLRKNSLKFKMLWFFESGYHHLLESIVKVAHFYILTLPEGEGGGGVTLTKKSKKIHFLKVGGENGHNSINIRASALKSLAFDTKQILVKIKLKSDTRLHKKSIFFGNLDKNSCLFSIFWLKKVKYLTFNI